MDRLLMHTCCAPCSVYCVEALRGEGIEPVSFWYNPNIHPYQEYKARRDTLVSYAEQIGMELIVREDYGLREFVGQWRGIWTTAAGTATPTAWRRPPGTPPNTATLISQPLFW